MPDSIIKSRVIQSILPKIVKDNIDVATFFALLSYVLFLVNWLVTTDWIEKLHLFSGATCAIGVFYLHYSEVVFLAKYEIPFLSLWLILLYYHYSTWQTNYQRVRSDLAGTPSSAIPASLRPFQGSIFRFFIIRPTTKNASNQWNPPPFKNTIHVVLVAGYVFLLGLHVVPFVTPYHCLGDGTGETSQGLSFVEKISRIFSAHSSSSQSSSSLLCCRYNYAMSDFEPHQMNRNYCSGRVRIAFAGSWSTGKTYLLSALLGRQYSTAQSAPAPTTDKFVCVAAGAPYSDPIRSDDYERRRHCEIMEHVNDVVRKECGGKKGMANVLDVADENVEFGDFVFFDMPGWQTEYGSDCVYRTFFHQLIDKVDYTYVVWDVNHGKIEDDFADFFQNKARGTNYELIYNRYTRDTVDMSFLNQQYAKMSTGQEILSEMYTTKVHENNTALAEQFHEDVLRLRSKIKSVNQTVHDNRKKMMKENLILHRDKMSGLNALRRLKICDRLINEDLNLHVRPRTYHWQRLGLEL
mmetsp:Transcript_7854/g.17041  ORF Transcript_7854/g.17041 Transcript_7854/m.17041 type:complete len:522 (+) Transcript_7854:73-1638(+)